MGRGRNLNLYHAIRNSQEANIVCCRHDFDVTCAQSRKQHNITSSNVQAWMKMRATLWPDIPPLPLLVIQKDPVVDSYPVLPACLPALLACLHCKPTNTNTHTDRANKCSWVMLFGKGKSCPVCLVSLLAGLLCFV